MTPDGNYLSYCFRLDTAIVNVRQPFREVASTALNVVGLAFSRVSMATKVPCKRMQSATAAQLDPAARSLSSAATASVFPIWTPQMQQCFLQQQQQQQQLAFAQMFAQQYSHGLQPPAVPMTPTPGYLPAFNLNVMLSSVISPAATPVAAPGVASNPQAAAKRQIDREDPGSPSKFPRTETAGDVSETRNHGTAAAAAGAAPGSAACYSCCDLAHEQQLITSTYILLSNYRLRLYLLKKENVH